MPICVDKIPISVESYAQIPHAEILISAGFRLAPGNANWVNDGWNGTTAQQGATAPELHPRIYPGGYPLGFRQRSDWAFSWGEVQNCMDGAHCASEHMDREDDPA
jgi:hypothetical protein